MTYGKLAIRFFLCLRKIFKVAWTNAFGTPINTPLASDDLITNFPQAIALLIKKMFLVNNPRTPQELPK